MSAPSTTKIGDTHEHRKKLWRLIYRGRTFHGPALTFALLLITVGVTGLLTKFVIWPGYLDPQARIYTSRLGHAAVMRRQGSGTDVAPDQVIERLILPMVNEAARCLEEGIVADAGQLDLAMIMGTGFPPFRGGLCRWADSQGLDQIRHSLERLSAQVDSRFEPSASLVSLQEAGGFYRLSA